MSTEAVANVTDALENTSISSPVATNESDVAHAASAAEGRRLYIGNLAYTTTEDQLKQFFEGYSVESISIPTNPRTGRAVGYAFVDLHSKDEADRAIGELSGKEVLERKVSVQAARKPGAQTTSAREGEAPAEGQEKKGRGRFAHRRRGRGRAGYKNRGNRESGSEGPEATQGQETQATEPDATTITKEASTKPNQTTPAGDAQGAFKGRRKRGPPEDGVPSKTKVMVANLPYELTEDKLKELFAAYEPESAKIALRPIRPFMVRILAARGEARKGRGFGFVTLASEEMQQKAIEEMNGKEIEGREIAVKVAIDNPKLEAEAEAKTEAATTEGDDVKGETPQADTTKPDEPNETENTTNGVKAAEAATA